MSEQLLEKQHTSTIYDGLLEMTKDTPGVSLRIVNELYKAEQQGVTFREKLQSAKGAPMPKDASEREDIIAELLIEAYRLHGTARRLELSNDPLAAAAHRVANRVSKIVGIYGTADESVKSVHDAVLSANAKDLKSKKGQRDPEGSYVVALHAEAVYGSVPSAIDYRPGSRKAVRADRIPSQTKSALAKSALTLGLSAIFVINSGVNPAAAVDQAPKPEPNAKTYPSPKAEALKPRDKTQPAHANLDTLVPPTQVKAMTTDIEPIESATISAQPTTIERIDEPKVAQPEVSALKSGSRISTKDFGTLTLNDILDTTPSQTEPDTTAGGGRATIAKTVIDKVEPVTPSPMPTLNGIEIGGPITVLPPKPDKPPKAITPDVVEPSVDSDEFDFGPNPSPIKIDKTPAPNTPAPDVIAPGEIVLPSETAPEDAKPAPEAPAPEAPAPVPVPAPVPEVAPAPVPAPEKPSIPEVIVNPELAQETMWSYNDLEFLRDNLEMYTNVEKQTGVPWEVMATLHFREASMGMSNPQNEQGLFQLYTLNQQEGMVFPFGPINREEFTRQAVLAANFLKQKAHELGYTDDQLTLANPDVIKDILFSYNGRAQVYANQAAALGFANPAEGSPYVMNLADDKRDSDKNPNWGQILTDGGPLGKANRAPGAWPLIQGLLDIQTVARSAAVAEADKKAAEEKAKNDAAQKAAEEAARIAKEKEKQSQLVGWPKTSAEAIEVFKQCDPRWGEIMSPNGQRACNIACGPTNVAIVASIFKPELGLTPQETIQYANDHRLWFTPPGRPADSGGTTFDAVIQLAANWGIEGNQMGNQWLKDFNKYKEIIEGGGKIIAAGSGPPPFVTPDIGAHFVTIVGTTDDGKFLVADPVPKTPDKGVVPWDANQMMQSTFGAVVLYEADNVKAQGAVEEALTNTSEQASEETNRVADVAPIDNEDFTLKKEEESSRVDAQDADDAKEAALEAEPEVTIESDVTTVSPGIATDSLEEEAKTSDQAQRDEAADAILKRLKLEEDAKQAKGQLIVDRILQSAQ